MAFDHDDLTRHFGQIWPVHNAQFCDLLITLRRQFGGDLDRMLVLAVAAPLAFALDAAWPLQVGAWLILAGALVTLVQRLLATRAASADVPKGDRP